MRPHPVLWSNPVLTETEMMEETMKEMMTNMMDMMGMTIGRRVRAGMW